MKRVRARKPAKATKANSTYRQPTHKQIVDGVYKKYIRRYCWTKKRHQNTNPGTNVIYKVEDGMLWLGCDLRVPPGKLSKTGKSRAIASSYGPYELSDFGYPDIFVILYVNKRRPLDEQVDYAGIVKDIAEEDNEVSTSAAFQAMPKVPK